MVQLTPQSFTLGLAPVVAEVKLVFQVFTLFQIVQIFLGRILEMFQMCGARLSQSTQFVLKYISCSNMSHLKPPLIYIYISIHTHIYTHTYIYIHTHIYIKHITKDTHTHRHLCICICKYIVTRLRL